MYGVAILFGKSFQSYKFLAAPSSLQYLKILGACEATSFSVEKRPENGKSLVKGSNPSLGLGSAVLPYLNKKVSKGLKT